MFTWRMQALSNDGKRMFLETNEEFFPIPGLALRGYAGDHEIKVNGVVWDRKDKRVKIAAVIMTMELPDSSELAQHGWQVVQPPK